MKYDIKSWSPILGLAGILALGATAGLAQTEQKMQGSPRPLVETIIPVPTPVPVTQGKIKLTDGTQLAYWDTGGTGEVIVLSHPATGNLESWMYQQPVFAQAGYRVIAYSRRGFYQSDYGPKDATGSQAKDLAELLDALKVDLVNVLGAAAGGSTALDFAMTYPERTLSAAIMSSILSIAEPDYDAALKSARGEWFNALDVDYKELSASFRVVYPEGRKVWKDVYLLNPTDKPRQPTTTEITWDKLAENKVPLLLSTGGADIYQPPELLMRTAERIANATVHIFPNAGHPVFAEQPDAFNQVVLDFFNAH